MQDSCVRAFLGGCCGIHSRLHQAYPPNTSLPVRLHLACTSTASQLELFRTALLSLLLCRTSAHLVEPVTVWTKALHDSVRDDRYLVGMRLQDYAIEVGVSHLLVLSVCRGA